MSAPSFKTPRGEDLATKMKSHHTVKCTNCKKCGNPWWFRLNHIDECTTCGHKKDEPGYHHSWPIDRSCDG